MGDNAELSAELRRRWDDLTTFVSPAVKERWWTLVHARHAARPFHNLQRLSAQLALFDEYKDQLKDRYAVAFAIFFKHLECEDDKSDEGTAAVRNVQRLREFCSETTFDQENYVANLLAESAKNCTDAHLHAGEFGEEDLHYFIDFDTAWLGTSDAGEYESATYDIRVESSRRLPDDQEYRRQRLRTLEFFLQIPNIFATRPFRERFESRARANIQREISTLRTQLEKNS